MDGSLDGRDSVSTPSGRDSVSTLAGISRHIGTVLMEDEYMPARVGTDVGENPLTYLLSQLQLLHLARTLNIQRVNAIREECTAALRQIQVDFDAAKQNAQSTINQARGPSVDAHFMSDGHPSCKDALAQMNHAQVTYLHSIQQARQLQTAAASPIHSEFARFEDVMKTRRDCIAGRQAVLVEAYKNRVTEAVRDAMGSKDGKGGPARHLSSRATMAFQRLVPIHACVDSFGQGCLRLQPRDFVPLHRDPMPTLDLQWSMGANTLHAFSTFNKIRLGMPKLRKDGDPESDIACWCISRSRSVYPLFRGARFLLCAPVRAHWEPLSEHHHQEDHMSAQCEESSRINELRWTDDPQWVRIAIQIDVADVYAFLEKALAPIVPLHVQRRYATQPRPATRLASSPGALTMHVIDVCFTSNHMVDHMQALHPRVFASVISVDP